MTKLAKAVHLGVLFAFFFVSSPVCFAASSSANLTVTIAPSGGGTIIPDYGPPYSGAVPATAAKVGFTHLAANYDFTQTQSFTDSKGTHQWSNLASWFTCDPFNTNTPNLWRFVGNVPCDANHYYITTDSGVQVFGVTYFKTDAQAGNGFMDIATVGDGANGDAADPFQEEFYMEMVIRVAQVSGTCSSFCINFDMSSYTHVQGNPCWWNIDMEFDDGAASTGVGMAQWNLTCGTSSGNGTSGPATSGEGAINTAVTTWGALSEADDLSTAAICVFQQAGAVSGLPASAWKSGCATATLVPPSDNRVFHNLVYGLMEPGPHSNNTLGAMVAASNTTYIQAIRFWQCPGYKSGACITNPVATTFP